MGNTLGYFITDKEEVPDPDALKVFLVLKGIFRHLSESELINARLVDRQWNFVAMSELASRRFHLSTIKLYQFSSNQFRDRDYGWYLEFENTRRSLWADVYGTDCPIIEFHHLDFGHPEKTEDFLKILRSPWLNSVTSLTLSMYSEICEDFLLNWFLPSFPNLQKLSCFIKPEVEENFTSNGSLGLDSLDQAPGFGSNNSLELKSESETQDRQIGSNLHSFSVCLEACSFPWSLLCSFPRLEDLKLEFGDAAALIKCAEDMIGTSSALRDLEVLEITLTHKPNLEEQIEDAEFNAEALALAAAKLCNQFRVRQSLNVISMIPAVNFLDFLKELTVTKSKQIKFEVAVPFYTTTRLDTFFRRFATYLIPEILFKFPDLSSLYLQFLQYYSAIHRPIHILSSRPTLDYFDRARQQRVKQLQLSTIAAEIETVEWNGIGLPIPYLRNAYLQQITLYFTKTWFQGIVELEVQASGWQDCVFIIDIASTTLKCVKKLVLRGLADVVKQELSSMFFFPEVNRASFPKKWYFGLEVSRQYEGLPGIRSLEVFRVEQFGVLYHPAIASEVARKMPRLKLIHLDQEFNNVVSADVHESWFEKHGRSGMMTSSWPSSVHHVKLLPEATVRHFFSLTDRSIFRRTTT